MSAIKLFDIQRGSFVDGPGVRTTVFFRGCNLRCEWCHNPESQSGGKHIFHYAEKCISCASCDAACPFGAISKGNVDYAGCAFCGKCEIVCPVGALRVSGFELEEDEIVKIVIRDKPFYDQSGGGVTFSGGESMLCPDDVASLARRCGENSVHVAVDTAVTVPWKFCETVMPYVDLFLYDIKTLDNEKHRRYTGASNERILDNLKRLLSSGKAVIVRIPVIPAINATAEDMRKIRDFLDENGGAPVELLPYHRLGENKYRALGMQPKKFDVPTDETMRELKKIFIGLV